MIESVTGIGPLLAMPAVPTAPPPVQAAQPRAEQPPTHVVATVVAPLLAQAPVPRAVAPPPTPPDVRPVALGLGARASATRSAGHGESAGATAIDAYRRALREATVLAVAAGLH